MDAYPTLFEKAAALFESLARNHCFYNGNKRTALASLDIFLKKNEDEMETFTVAVAQGIVTTSDIIGWLRMNTVEY